MSRLREEVGERWIEEKTGVGGCWRDDDDEAGECEYERTGEGVRALECEDKKRSGGDV
jgi:hypothetical protein